MSICYDDSVKKSFLPVPYEEQDANRYYMTHYENFLYLSFIAQKSDVPTERTQARKEIEIANRKMTFWKRHINYNQNVINEMCIVAKKKWS